MNDIVKLPRPLAARLERAFVDQGVAPSTITRKAITEHLQYLEWERAGIRGRRCGHSGWTADEYGASIRGRCKAAICACR